MSVCEWSAPTATQTKTNGRTRRRDRRRSVDRRPSTVVLLASFLPPSCLPSLCICLAFSALSRWSCSSEETQSWAVPSLFRQHRSNTFIAFVTQVTAIILLKFFQLNTQTYVFSRVLEIVLQKCNLAVMILSGALERKIYLDSVYVMKFKSLNTVQRIMRLSLYSTSKIDYCFKRFC